MYCKTGQKNPAEFNQVPVIKTQAELIKLVDQFLSTGLFQFPYYLAKVDQQMFEIF